MNLIVFAIAVYDTVKQYDRNYGHLSYGFRVSEAEWRERMAAVCVSFIQQFEIVSFRGSQN